MNLRVAPNQFLILEIPIPEELDDALKFLDTLIGCLDELNIIMKKTSEELSGSQFIEKEENE